MPLKFDPKNDPFREEREAMVRYQIEARGIKDPRVLEAMRKVPRHLFVPLEYRDFSYEDRPLPIGEGQTISQPYIIALMTQALDLKGEEKVLEIGTGSGYQAAILGELAKEVFSIELEKSLAERAKKLLEQLGYDNIRVIVGDGFFGLPEEAPFDRIIITCAAPRIPEPLIDQLKDGGRMVLPLGEMPYHQDLILVKKKGKELEVEDLGGVVFVPMRGVIQKKEVLR